VRTNRAQESSESLVAGKAFAPPQRDQTHPLGPKARAVVQTTIEVREAPSGSCSILQVVTSDRPGLLVDIVSVLKDINVNVVSAEIDTIGGEARDDFFVTYHGEPLNPPMVQLVTNSLQYYLSLSEVAKVRFAWWRMRWGGGGGVSGGMLSPVWMHCLAGSASDCCCLCTQEESY
jgi:UTP:GlnB (protein PII) uridylyltransferase